MQKYVAFLVLYNIFKNSQIIFHYNLKVNPSELQQNIIYIFVNKIICFYYYFAIPESLRLKSHHFLLNLFIHAKLSHRS